MRLHLWPASKRRAVTRHPRVHNHGFHLVARVIAGTYRECIFEASSIARTPSGRWVSLARYEVRSDGRSNTDVVEAVDSRMFVCPIGRPRMTELGRSHELPAGAFHSTLIPYGSACATIAVMSPRIPGAVDILLGPAGYDHEVRTRDAFSTDDLRLVSQEIVQHTLRTHSSEGR